MAKHKWHQYKREKPSGGKIIVHEHYKELKDRPETVSDEWVKNLNEKIYRDRESIKKVDIKNDNIREKIINENTIIKFRAMKEMEAKYPQYDIERGFGIGASGQLTGRYDTSVIIGGVNRANIHNEARKELHEDLKYVVHSHPFDKRFSDIFSFEDLNGGAMLGHIPVLFYQDEINHFNLKIIENIPCHEALVKEYKVIFDDYENAVDKLNSSFEATQK